MTVRNYLNYIGSKDRYLPQIMTFIEKGAELMPSSRFVDLFCGSAVVGLNASPLFDHVYCVDSCKQLIDLHNWILYSDKQDIFDTLDGLIEEYGLSKTNKKGFLKLRQDYNESEYKEIMSPHLYMLITHSFNYSMHFNKSGGFSVPFGTNKSSFNNSLRKKLENWKDALDKCVIEEVDMRSEKITFQATSFNHWINEYLDDKVYDDGRIRAVNDGMVFFVDPPYSASLSKHPYRVGSSKWGEDEDRALLHILDRIHNSENLFIFTNCISNNGVTNKILSDWLFRNKDKYYQTPVSVDYKNCSYQRSNRGNTNEVIITNFTL